MTFLHRVSSGALSIGHREVEEDKHYFPALPARFISTPRASLLSPSIDITSTLNNCACIRWFLIVRSQCNMAMELLSRPMLQRASTWAGTDNHTRPDSTSG